jgi:CDP-diacylglycerol--serine O-phosphatidyltransferase
MTESHNDPGGHGPDGTSHGGSELPRRMIAVLPTLFTLGNLLCGFAALGYASAPPSKITTFMNNFSLAGYLIFAAMICDMLDGSMARLARATSDFGAELDSLADVVSFGVTPAFLSLKLIGHVLLQTRPAYDGHIGPLAHSMDGRFFWIIAAVYVACAGLRLARFNTMTQHDIDSHMAFRGLPSPGAAGVVAASVIFFEALQPGAPHVLPFNVPPLISGWVLASFPYTMPLILLLVALLMVSRVSYDHVINQYLRGRKPFAYVVRAVLLILFLLWQPQTAALIAIYFYAFWPLIKAGWRRITGRRLTATASHAAHARVAALRGEEQGTDLK